MSFSNKYCSLLHDIQATISLREREAGEKSRVRSQKTDNGNKIFARIVSAGHTIELETYDYPESSFSLLQINQAARELAMRFGVPGNAYIRVL